MVVALILRLNGDPANDASTDEKSNMAIPDNPLEGHLVDDPSAPVTGSSSSLEKPSVVEHAQTPETMQSLEERAPADSP